MPDLSGWLYDGDAIDTNMRAVDAWNRINRSPTTISVSRRDGDPPDQVVRIEHDNTARESRNRSDSLMGSRYLTVFGVTGHPDAGVSDTDLNRGDTFSVNGLAYRVVDVAYPLGELQARAEVMG